MINDKIQTVAIVGVGLIGGSFGLALRKNGFRGTIMGVSSPRSIGDARERRAIDWGATLEEAAEKADLIFLSQPISGILQTIDDLEPLLVKRRVLVTDAGSTKVAIEKKAQVHLRDSLFIGGHPMAGKETRGVGAADADLFRGRPWVLTGEWDHPLENEFRGYLEEFGARIVVLKPEEHDRMVAWGSHLPQVVSSALAALIAKHEPRAAEIAGPGLMDMTRLAMSSYDLWGDILSTNRIEIAEALRAFAADLESADGDFAKTFSEGSEFAKRLREADR